MLNEILKSEKTIPVAYSIDTGIVINENNIESILEIEILKALNKLKLINNCIEEIKIIDAIKNHYKIGKKYLLIEYAYLNKENCLDSINDIESKQGFYKWF